MYSTWHPASAPSPSRRVGNPLLSAPRSTVQVALHNVANVVAGDSLWVGYGSGKVMRFDLATGDQTHKFKASRSALCCSVDGLISSAIKSLVVDASKKCDWLATGCSSGLQVSWHFYRCVICCSGLGFDRARQQTFPTLWACQHSHTPVKLTGWRLPTLGVTGTSPSQPCLLRVFQEGADRTISLWAPRSGSKAAIRSFSLTSSPAQLLFGEIQLAPPV